MTMRHYFRAHDPTETGFKWILIIGRLLGALPLSISLIPHTSLHFRWCSLSTLHTSLIVLILATIGFLQISQRLYFIRTYQNVFDRIEALEASGYHLNLMLLYLYFVRNANRLVDLLNKWGEVTQHMKFSTKDEGFPKFCILIIVLILGIGITENILSNASLMEFHAKEIEGQPFLSKLFYVEATAAAEFFPDSLLLNIVFMYCLKMGTYSWSYGDIFLIAMCRALSFQFDQINTDILQRLKFPSSRRDSGTQTPEIIVQNVNVVTTNAVDEQAINKNVLHESCSSKITFEASWKVTREKILKLCVLSGEVTSFIGPLVLISYGFTIFLIIIRILQFLYDSNTIVEGSAYICTSSVQFILRVVLVTYYASQVYHSTERIVRTMEFSEDLFYSETAKRLEMMLERHPVGVTIFGTITITRKFFLSIISFIFTTEIILLQAMSTGNHGKAYSREAVPKIVSS